MLGSGSLPELTVALRRLDTGGRRMDAIRVQDQPKKTVIIGEQAVMLRRGVVNSGRVNLTVRRKITLNP